MASKPLNDAEVEEVRSWLTPQTAELFFDQPHPDQRHGFEAGMSVIRSGAVERELVRAAALHDIAKRSAGLGAIGRSVASILIAIRIPWSVRIRKYRDHGPTAAVELAAAGASELVVDFARHHHGARPTSIAVPQWEVLIAADQPAKTLKKPKPPISSPET